MLRYDALVSSRFIGREVMSSWSIPMGGELFIPITLRLIAIRCGVPSGTRRSARTGFLKPPHETLPNKGAPVNWPGFFQFDGRFSISARGVLRGQSLSFSLGRNICSRHLPRLLINSLMRAQVTYWKESDGRYLGYLNEYPGHWTQGDSLEDLREHLKDLFHTFGSEQIPGIRKVEELEIA